MQVAERCASLRGGQRLALSGLPSFCPPLYGQRNVKVAPSFFCKHTTVVYEWFEYMRYRVFSVGLPVLLAAGATAIVLAFDFAQRANAQEGVTFASYFTEIPDRMSRMFDEPPPPVPTLAEVVPQTAPAWSGRPAEPEDYLALGATAPAAPEGSAQEAVTLTRQERTTILTVTLHPAGSGDAGQIAVTPDQAAVPFAAVQGVTFMLLPMQESDKARRIAASLGGQLEFDLITTGTDRQILLALGALDMVAFNRLLHDPVATIDPEAEAVLVPRAPTTSQISAVPMAPPVPDAQVVHRGGNGVAMSDKCTITKGIRRCTVSGN